MPRLAVIQHYLEYITNITTSMGKLFTPIFALFLILINPQDCSDFKTGTFVIEDESYGGSVLIRTKTHQEEIVEKLGIHSRFDLMWINDCKYALFNGSVIKGEDTLPRGKKVVLQADDKEYDRGLIVQYKEDGSYDIEYWYFQ